MSSTRIRTRQRPAASLPRTTRLRSLAPLSRRAVRLAPATSEDNAMPYAPGNVDRSGELLAAGIGGAGDAIAEAMQRARKTKEEDGLLRAHLNDAIAGGAIPKDQGAELVADFLAGNHKKKMEIGLSAQLASKRIETERSRDIDWARVLAEKERANEQTQ